MEVIALSEKTIQQSAAVGKHTPGPWTAGRPDMATVVEGFDSKYIYGPGEAPACTSVAIAWGGDIEAWDEVMANARLIAAAPDLLAALKAVLGDIDAGVLVRNVTLDGAPQWATEMLAFVQRLQAAQMAVAKAEGRS